MSFVYCQFVESESHFRHSPQPCPAMFCLLDREITHKWPLQWITGQQGYTELNVINKGHNPSHTDPVVYTVKFVKDLMIQAIDVSLVNMFALMQSRVLKCNMTFHYDLSISRNTVSYHTVLPYRTSVRTRHSCLSWWRNVNVYGCYWHQKKTLNFLDTARFS